MAKKDMKGPSKADEADDGADEREEGASAATARPASAMERRARMRERRAAAPPADDHGHGHHGHDHGHEEEEIDTSNDPSWWVPHAVLGALVLVGILGFFGAFNTVAARLGYKGMPELTAADAHGHGHAHGTSKPADAKPPEPRPAPQPPQMPQRPEAREMFGAKHLLVMYKGSMRAPENISRTKDEAKARAEEALKKAKAGTKFEDLVTEYSDEPGAGQRGGDLGKFPKGRMVPQFQEGLEKTKVGQVSDLVETPFGYHVILRTQ